MNKNTPSFLKIVETENAAFSRSNLKKLSKRPQSAEGIEKQGVNAHAEMLSWRSL